MCFTSLEINLPVGAIVLSISLGISYFRFLLQAQLSKLQLFFVVLVSYLIGYWGLNWLGCGIQRMAPGYGDIVGLLALSLFLVYGIWLRSPNDTKNIASVIAVGIVEGACILATLGEASMDVYRYQMLCASLAIILADIAYQRWKVSLKDITYPSLTLPALSIFIWQVLVAITS